MIDVNEIDRRFQQFMDALQDTARPVESYIGLAEDYASRLNDAAKAAKDGL